MKITILGCGSSVGVPSIGCTCEVCVSDSVYNKRTRTSALVQKGDTSVLIDASPDLRFQALRNGFCSVDAVLLTHCHSDHSGGIPELQAFTPKGGIYSIPVYSDFGTIAMVLACNAYMFVPSKPGAPWKKCHYLTAHSIRHGVEFYIGELKIVPFKQHHGEINSNGFIFDDSIAYCTDVKSFPSESWDILKNKKVLILGCLRYQEVGAHAHVDLCIEWIKELKPSMAVLTHMSHDIDYNKVKEYVDAKLEGEGIKVAYDGMCLEV